MPFNYILLFVGAGNSADAQYAYAEVIEKLYADRLRQGGNGKTIVLNHIIMDLPGHGSQTAQCDNLYQWADHVANFIIDQCKMSTPDINKKVIVIGNSLGGHLIYGIMQDLMKKKADCVSKVFFVISGAPPKYSGKLTEPQYAPKNYATTVAISLLPKETFTAEDAEIFVKCQFPKDYNKEVIDNYRNAAMDTKFRKELVTSLFEGGLNEIKVLESWLFSHVLMIHAEDDAAVNVKYFDYVDSKNFYSSKLIICPGTHQCMKTNSNEYAAILIDFIVNI